MAAQLLLRQVEVCARLGISDETWRRWRKARIAPMPVDLPGAKRWRAEDIEALATRGIARLRRVSA